MTPLELADWLDGESCTPHCEHEDCVRFRAAAAALRSLVAERDEARVLGRELAGALATLAAQVAKWNEAVESFIGRQPESGIYPADPKLLAKARKAGWLEGK